MRKLYCFLFLLIIPLCSCASQPLDSIPTINSPQEIKLGYKISEINLYSNIKSNINKINLDSGLNFSPSQNTFIQLGYREIDNKKSSELTIKSNLSLFNSKNKLDFIHISPFINKDINKNQTNINLLIDSIDNINIIGNYKNTGDKKTELGNLMAKINVPLNNSVDSLNMSFVSPFINKDINPEQTNVDLTINSIDNLKLSGNYKNSDGKTIETYKASFAPSELLDAEVNIISNDDNIDKKYRINSNLFNILKLHSSWIDKNDENISKDYNLVLNPSNAISIEGNFVDTKDILSQKYKINTQIGEYLNVNSVWAKKDTETTNNDMNIEFKTKILQIKSKLINYEINNITIGIVFFKNGLMSITHNQNDLENWQNYLFTYNLKNNSINKLKSLCEFNTKTKDIKAQLELEYKF